MSAYNRLDALGRLTLRVGWQQVGAVGTGHVPVAGLYRLVVVLGQLGRLLFVGLGERSGLGLALGGAVGAGAEREQRPRRSG